MRKTIIFLIGVMYMLSFMYVSLVSITSTTGTVVHAASTSGTSGKAYCFYWKYKGTNNPNIEECRLTQSSCDSTRTRIISEQGESSVDVTSCQLVVPRDTSVTTIGTVSTSNSTGNGDQTTTSTGNGDKTTTSTGNGDKTTTSEGNGDCGLTQLCNPLKYDSVCSLLQAILDILTQVGAIIAVIFIIWTGFKFITAQGNPGKIGEARKMFYTTIVGTAVLLGASGIAQIVINTVLTITSQNNPGVCRI